MRLSPNILIRVGNSVRGSHRGWQPSVPTPAERYSDFQVRHRAHTQDIPYNNYPWKFRHIPAMEAENV